ncbi:MAG: putative membrane protein SpoIIM required for sporulation [Myxococcota bacterium]|jgi:uncharacterized membrane protein SpoIIM required for sporulation
MTGQDRFVARHTTDWEALEQVLDRLEGGQTVAAPDFPQAYRRLCQQLALARSRAYNPDLVDRLNRMVLRGHQQLYGRPLIAPRLLEGIQRTFPRRVRQEWRLVAASAALFVLPLLLTVLAIKLNPESIHSVLDPMMLENVEQMYDPDSEQFLHERSAETDIEMFGFYIRNNIGVGFRIFASGLLAGLGSVFFLMFNGVSIGAVIGHLENIGFVGTLYPFMIAHGAFELTAIVLAGAAGLRLGLALIAPGRYSRRTAMAQAAKTAMPIVYGFTGMLVIAAGLEAFWSPRHTLPLGLRYGVGAAMWVLVGVYLAGAGRGDATR